MKPAHLKIGLFGFKRKQVLQYIDGMAADFAKQTCENAARHEAEVSSLREELEEKIRVHQNALDIMTKDSKRLEEELSQIAGSLEEKYALLQTEQTKNDTLTRQLALREEQIVRLQQAGEVADAQLVQYKEQLAARDSRLESQTLEVTRLQEHVTRLEEAFSAVREDAEQSTAMVNCLNLLHGRNRALSHKVAKLEAQLEEMRMGSEVEEYAKMAGKQQVAVQTTEHLFASVRQEIQDALETLSHKIEDGFGQQPAEENRFVDLANL